MKYQLLRKSNIPVNYFILIYKLKDELDCSCEYKHGVPVRLFYKDSVIDGINCFVYTNDKEFLRFVIKKSNEVEKYLKEKMKTLPKLENDALFSNSLVYTYDMERENLYENLLIISYLFKKYKDYNIVNGNYRLYVECRNELDLIMIIDNRIVATPLNILRERVNYFSIDLLELFKIFTFSK